MAKVSRRRFIRNSMTTAAAVTAFPYIAGAQSPNETLGIAVIGVRGRGGSHLGGFSKDPRTEVRYIVEVDEKVAASRCQEMQKGTGKSPKIVRDMREAFDDPAVDMISVATPNHWHALAGIWAMQAGKDAYIEKPVCHEIAEGTALIAAARKHGRICQVGTQCRSNPAVRDAVAFMEAGGIGEVNFARGLCYKRRGSIGPLGNYPMPPEVDFTLWSGPATYTNPKLTRERFHYDWHWQRHYGNGDLGNQGPHQTDIARWGLGIDTHPNSIVSYGGRLGYQAERKDPNYIDAGDTGNTEVSIYDYGKKCIVFETRGLDVADSADDELNKLFNHTRGNIIGVVFYGSEGILVQKSYTECIVYDKQYNEVKRFKGEGNHWANFIDACVSRNKDDLNADVREGHLSAGVSHLGNISYYLGEDNKVSVTEAGKILDGIKSLDDNAKTLDRTVKHLVKNGVDLEKYPMSMGPLLKFDPDKEVFPDSPEATAMVTREYREGFVCPKADSV